VYCSNNPINEFDQDGRKGRNSVRNYYNENGGFVNVTTKIRFMGSFFVFKYKVDSNGSIAFNFADNPNYRYMLQYGGDDKLIESMEESILYTTGTHLNNRTFSGLRYELMAHYQLTVMSRGRSDAIGKWIFIRAETANMGSTGFPYVIKGYVNDNDCIFFEIASWATNFGDHGRKVVSHW
jgi:hypothetical protein